MRQPALLSLALVVGLTISCRGKTKESSGAADESKESGEGGTVNGYVDEKSTGDDDDEFVQAQDPTSVSGTNLVLLSTAARHETVVVDAGGSVQRQLASEVPLDGQRFSVSLSPGTYSIVSSNGVQALLPAIRAGATPAGAPPALGVVVDLASAATVRVFDRMAAQAPHLVAAQTLDLIGLSDLGVTVARAERRQPGFLSEANADLIAAQFVAANQDVLATMQAQGVDDARFADLMAGAVITGMAGALVDSAMSTGAYDLRQVVAAARASFQQRATEAGQPSGGNPKANDSTAGFFTKVASDASVLGPLEILVKQRIYDQSVVQMTAVLQSADPSAAADAKTTLWAVIDGQPSTTLASLVSEAAVGSNPVTTFVDAVAESGGDASTIQAAIDLAEAGVAAKLDIDVARTHLQTRQSLVMTLTVEPRDRGGLVSVVDAATGDAVVPGLSVDEAASGQGFAWTPTAASASLVLGPSGEAFGGRLTYGVNKLRAVWEADDDRVDSATVDIVLRDFPVFSPSATAFLQDRQTKDGYQGWIGATPGRLKATDGSTLTVGFFNIINR